MTQKSDEKNRGIQSCSSLIARYAPHARTSMMRGSITGREAPFAIAILRALSERPAAARS
jgi:hypothetical protein